ARHELQRGARNAGPMQQFDRFAADQRRLLGGLGYDRIAGDQSGGDLPQEDRQRKIPRTDADEDTAAAIAQAIVLAGRPRQNLVADEDAAGFGRIETAEI